jgi:16S rRNA (guanine527-N7)-methyltransferase
MDQFIADAQSYFNIALTVGQKVMFEAYENALLEWNKKINLTALKSYSDIRIKHFLDSLSCTLAWKNRNIPHNIIDIGTGAGFPGIVLKILYPDLHLTLVESVEKKAKFCRHIIENLNLEHVEIVTQRAEVLGQNQKYREQFDCAVARAVAMLPVLSEYLLPFVKIGGIMISQKGNQVENEVALSQKSFSVLGGKLNRIIPIVLPGDIQPRSLLVIDKISPTPKIYPRSVGVPAKNPLIN